MLPSTIHDPGRSVAGADPGADAPLEIIDRLLTAGCPLNAVDSTGRTALWCAATTGTAPWPAERQAARYRVLRHLLDRVRPMRTPDP